MRLALVLVSLTSVNVYVFFFRDDTAVRNLMQPSSTAKLLAREKERVITESIPKPAATATAATRKGSRAAPAPTGMGPKPAGAAAGAAVTTTEPSASTPSGGDNGGRTIEGKFGPADTLGTVLAREGLGIHAGPIVKALSKLTDPKLIRPAEGYSVAFDAEGAPESFEYLPSPVLRYEVTPLADGAWQARKEEKPLELKIAEAAGTIDSSLYESVQKAGEQAALVSLFVDLFAWDMNFYIDTHPGDHWKVVVEKQYLGGQFYKYGHVLAAEYGGKVGTFRAFYWAPRPGQTGRYYDEKGQAIAKTMLKSPLRYVRISSKFDRNRFHPILHRTKAHLGVDYAAPTGTPVWASMSGKLAEVAAKPGSGNTVVIAHGQGVQTRYYHLSRFAKGLRAGQMVQQKEIIGYVGTTGLSTGPHLHFSVTRGGVFIDPSKLQILREAPVADRAGFLATIRPRLASLKALPPVVAKN